MKRMNRLQAWLSIFLIIILVTYSAAQVPQPQPVKPEVKLPHLLTAEPLKEDPRDDELRKLLKARYNEVVGEVKGLYQLYMAGRGSIDIFAEAGQRLVQAGLELYDKPAEKVTLLTQYLELTKEVEKLAQARHDAGQVFVTEIHRARYQRLDAEIQLLRAKREAEKAKGK
jgi:hypothetical protein